MQVFFDTPHLYYLPQYAPVITELQNAGHQCHVVLYEGKDTDTKTTAVKNLSAKFSVVNNESEAIELYETEAPEWVVFGNDFSFERTLSPKTQTALLFHGSGTGVKSASLSEGLGDFNVRFVSGPGRMKIFAERFPNVKLVQTGFAKLDPLLRPELKEQSKLNLSALGLDPNKPTILYAPTFYPSSIENMGNNFPDEFRAYNILIKCHDFTRTKKKYTHQLKKLEQWALSNNVYFANENEYSLVPFMATADIMITDTSSAIFEFAALNRPVLTCDFVKLRWTYRGPFRYKLRKRLDPTTLKYQQVAQSVTHYKLLKETVERHLNQPNLLEDKRLEYSEEIMGQLDGRAAIRVADYLVQESEKIQ